MGIYAAAVEPLGADACAIYQKAGASAEDCRAAAYHQEHRVYADTLSSARQAFEQADDRRYPYQIILIGGGIDGPVHGPLLERMALAFNRRFNRPQLDPALGCEAETQAGRLVLADGLARSPVDLKDVAMPRDRLEASTHFGADPNSKDVC